MADLTTGFIPKALGPTTIGDSIFSETGGAGSVAGLLHVFGDLVLHGATSGTLSLKAPAAAGASVITLPSGTTNFTGTGGAGQVLQQATLGGPITVGVLPGSSVGGFTSGSVLFADSSGSIAQDNANLRWDDTNNRLGLGGAPSNTLSIYAGTDTTPLFVERDGGFINPTYTVYSPVSMANSSSNQLYRYARGTKALPLDVVAGDRLAALTAHGYGGADFRSAAQITVRVDAGTISATSLPGYIAFLTSPSGSIVPVENMRLSSAGFLGIQNTNPQAMLSIGRTGAVGTARSYNLFTDASNGEFAYLGDWSSNVARYGTDKNGTGTARVARFLGGGIQGIEISALGEVTIGPSAAPTSLFNISGTYAGANTQLANVSATFASSGATTQWGLWWHPTYAPTGASLSTLYNFFADPTLAASAVPITTYNGIASRLSLAAGYSAVPPIANMVFILDPVLNGNAPFATLRGFAVGALTNGNGLTSGSVTNQGILVNAITAGAAGGTLANRGAQISVPSGGASSGSASNYGVYITGNGGTAAGGTVTNFALYSDSTAMSRLTGGLQVGTTTLLSSSVALSNGAAAAAGTLTNAPVAGNPTKWIAIDDNGTVRRIPAW